MKCSNECMPLNWFIILTRINAVISFINHTHQPSYHNWCMSHTIVKTCWMHSIILSYLSIILTNTIVPWCSQSHCITWTDEYQTSAFNVILLYSKILRFLWKYMMWTQISDHLKKNVLWNWMWLDFKTLFQPCKSSFHSIRTKVVLSMDHMSVV
mgnify:CR=1 FL=1